MSKEFFLPFPRVVRIEPSSLCNLRCSHCPTGTVDMKRGLMSEEVFNRILEQLEENLADIKVVVMYHGGEPLMNSQFSHMVSKIKSMGIPYVKTVSNGMLLNNELIQEITSSELDYIEFSLDGENIQENNIIRRGCNGQRVINNIKELIRYKEEKKINKPDICVYTTQFIDNKDVEINNYRVPDYLYNEFRDEIKEFKLGLAMRWPGMNVLDNMYDVYIDDKLNNNNYCDHIINTVTIRWNGDIVPCCYDLTSRYVIDNIMNNDLKDIWNSKKYIDIRQQISNRKLNSLCENCNIVNENNFLIKKF